MFDAQYMLLEMSEDMIIKLLKNEVTIRQAWRSSNKIISFYLDYGDWWKNKDCILKCDESKSIERFTGLTLIDDYSSEEEVIGKVLSEIEIIDIEERVRL